MYGDFIGPPTKAAIIVKRLQNALDWTKVHEGRSQTHEEIKIACVSLLRQSPTDYSRWVNHYKRSAAKSPHFLRALVELAISDVDCAPYDYQMPWQLDQFSHGSKAVKAALETTCDRCGAAFRPARKDTRFCSARCKQAAHRKRKRYGSRPKSGTPAV